MMLDVYRWWVPVLAHAFKSSYWCSALQYVSGFPCSTKFWACWLFLTLLLQLVSGCYTLCCILLQITSVLGFPECKSGKDMPCCLLTLLITVLGSQSTTLQGVSCWCACYIFHLMMMPVLCSLASEWLAYHIVSWSSWQHLSLVLQDVSC